jgi:hypothetical protein
MVQGNWMNNDGLYLKFGTSKVVPATAGEFMSYGETRISEFFIDLTTLPAFGTGSIPVGADVAFIPSGAYIEQVEVECELAGAGATATLNVGLVGYDRTTVASATGFVNAMTVATLVQGSKTILVGGSTFAGGYIGTVAGTPSPGYLWVTANTANFTAGKIRLRIKWRLTTTITQ